MIAARKKTTLTPAQLAARRRIGLASRGDRGPRGGAYREGSRYMEMGTESKLQQVRRVVGDRVVEFLAIRRAEEDPSGTFGGGWVTMHDLRRACFNDKPDQGSGLLVVVQGLEATGKVETRGGGKDEFRSTFMVRIKR